MRCSFRNGLGNWLMRFRDWVISLAGFVAVAFAIFAIGGVLRWSQAIVALLVAISVAGTAFSQRVQGRVSPLIALLAAAAVLTLLQLILPAGSLSATTAALRADGAELMNVEPWSATTADAGATLAALIMLLTLLGVAVVALRIATSERGRYRIVAAVAALCGLAALVTLIHKLLGLHVLYGLYEPQYADPYMLGPLLNGNSLACLTAFGALLCVGLSAHRRQPNWLRALWLLLVLPCGAVTVGTVSRGGTIALMSGALVTVAVLVAQRFSNREGSKKRRARLLSGALPMGVLAACLVVLVIYSNAGNVERQLSELSFDEVHYSRSKFAAWRSAATLVEESPWLGAGRGAFEAVFTRVHEASGLATYVYLENEYLQALVDWGIPGSIVLVIIFLWLAYLLAHRWRDGALAAGALGALVAVAMQSNVDFGLQFVGLAAPVTAVAATLAYVPLREARRPRFVRGLRVAHALALVVGALVLFSSITTTLDEDRRAIASEPTLDRVRESVRRHPLDYYGYAVAADLLNRQKDPRAIRLLNHAMALHPTHPQLHRMAARMLHAQGFVSQSTIEYAAALRATPNPRQLLTEIVARFPPEEAATAIPVDYSQPHVIMSNLTELKATAVARIWLTRVLDFGRNVSRACGLMFKLAEAGDAEAANVCGRRCVEFLPDYQSRVTLAKQLAAKLNYGGAIQLLHDVEMWQARRDEKVDAWLLLCDAHRALGHSDDAKKCLRRLDASSDMYNERRAEILQRLEAINKGTPGGPSGSTSP